MWRSWNVPRISLLVAMGAATALSGDTLVAQTDYQPSPENLQSRREFQDAKFGMFIHWSVYSVLGAGEWVFHERKLTVDEYNLLPSFFDPEKFDAKTWVSLAKAAGMKYITITSRHHDGFAMFDSRMGSEGGGRLVISVGGGQPFRGDLLRRSPSSSPEIRVHFRRSNRHR